jgi:hypothetical protein
LGVHVQNDWIDSAGAVLVSTTVGAASSKKEDGSSSFGMEERVDSGLD